MGLSENSREHPSIPMDYIIFSMNIAILRDPLFWDKQISGDARCTYRHIKAWLVETHHNHVHFQVGAKQSVTRDPGAPLIPYQYWVPCGTCPANEDVRSHVFFPRLSVQPSWFILLRGGLHRKSYYFHDDLCVFVSSGTPIQQTNR